MEGTAGGNPMKNAVIFSRRSRTVQVQGQTYPIGRFTPRDLDELQEWLNEAVPDPRAKAIEMCRGLPDAIALQVWADISIEARSWPPRIDGIEGNRLLTMTHEGASRVIWTLLRRASPSLDLAASRSLAEVFSLDDLIRLIAMGLPSRPAPSLSGDAT